MDNNDTTAYDLNIGQFGVLNFSTSTPTYLRLGGSSNYLSNIYYNGAMTIGTPSTPVASTSAVLELSANAAGKVGLNVYGSFTTFGNSKSQFIPLSGVSGAALAGSNTIYLSVAPTNWVAGDVIGIPSTTQSYIQSESATIQSITNNVITATTTLASTHSAVGYMDAAVVNLTRNVKIRGVAPGAFNWGSVNVVLSGAVNLNNTEFYYMGTTTANNQALALYGIANPIRQTVNGCTFHDVSVVRSTNAYFLNNTVYSTTNHGIDVGATTFTNVLSGNIVYRGPATANIYGINLGDVGATVVGNRVAGFNTGGMFITESADLGIFSNNIIHSCTNYGILFDNSGTIPFGGIINNCKVWRIGNNTVASGNGTFGMAIAALPANFSTTYDYLCCINCVGIGCGYSGATTPGSNFLIFSNSVGQIIFENCTTTTDYIPTNDINIQSTTAPAQSYSGTIYVNNCTLTAGSLPINTFATFNGVVYINSGKYNLGAPTQSNLSNTTYGGIQPSIVYNNYNSVNNNFIMYTKKGSLSSDYGIFKTTAPSEKITPTSSTSLTVRYQSSSRFVSVNSGDIINVSVWVNKNSNYTGTNATLVLKMNPIMGYSGDTVLATHNNISTSWVQLVGSTIPAPQDGVYEFCVECDGSGSLNIDDWNFY
ncbi:MAG: hypothetical protein EBU90_26990 [Proteobacteria bacterium]|nr:hypothetical protein [Pseudomonadota bacterium]